MPTETNEQGFELENLSRLKFYDSNFTYDGRDFSYEDISSIQYSAVQTKHSINFVPTGTTYEATLCVFFDSGASIHIRQERKLFGKQKEFYLAVARASSMLSQISFGKRLATYYSQMKHKGFVSWSDVQISRDGNLFYRNELAFRIGGGDYSLLLLPFAVRLVKKNKSLTEKLKVAWSGDLILPIDRDRDCFLYLMKYEFGLSWPNENVADKISSFHQETPKASNKERDRYLALLGLSKDATVNDIKLAYRAHVRRLHPDILRAAGATASEIQLAEESLKLMIHAYEKLTTDSSA